MNHLEVRKAHQGDPNAFNYKPVPANGATIPGIDLSKWNNPPQWSGDFAWIKATQGLEVDGEFHSNWQGAKNRGIFKGGYAYLDAAVDPNMQAEFFVNTVGSDSDLGYALDWEVSPGAVETARIFLAKVAALTGRRPVLYSYPAFLQSLGADLQYFADYDLWIANPGGTAPNLPPGLTKWIFWQYRFGAEVNGVVTPDQNLFNGDLAALKAYCQKTA